MSGFLISTQITQLDDNIKKSRRDLKEGVWRCYNNVALLGKNNEVRFIDLGNMHSSAAASIIQFIVNELMHVDEIQTGIGPNLLVRNWPPAIPEWNTRAVRDAFFASPLFPRLLNADAVKETIARGVSNGQLAYVGKTGSGRYPGAGKSVCAYQVALELVKDGWKVFRLRDPKIDDPEFTSSGVDARTLFLIDDAHLMLETRLKSAEERTNSSALLLSTHTISGEFANVRGAVTIDSRRAVRTIAAELRANLAETLRLVHIADSMVGEGAGAVLDTVGHAIVEDLTALMRHKVATLVIWPGRVPIRSTNDRTQLSVDVQATIEDDMERHATGNIPSR